MNNARQTTILSILLFAGLSACSDPKPAQAPDKPMAAHLIVEGTGVAGIALGMTEAEVRARLGEPASVNRDGTRIVYMSYHPKDIFGVYFNRDSGRVRMIIAAVQDKTFCTSFDVCLYREGDLSKLVAHHGKALYRFTDRDGSVTFRLLSGQGDQQVLTEYSPVEQHKGVVQVAILYWSGRIDTSSFD